MVMQQQQIKRTDLQQHDLSAPDGKRKEIQ
jgi:hypothetical protein